MISNRQSFTGGFRELFVLFIPLALATFSNCIFLLVEKLLLARLSTEAMEAAVNVTYACHIFQIPCTALALMAQVYVGRWRGAGEYHLIGPGTWQFIWFSFLSMLITVPASLLYGKYYFQGSALEEIAMPYFYLLVSMNFLFPLAATMSALFLGLGKTRLILLTTVGSQALKLVLAYLLIFGWGSWIPAFGLLGGALSTVLAQAGFCLVLFTIFLNPKDASLYHSYKWHFQFTLFWECIQPSLLRACNRILTTTSWASTAYLMSSRGGDYLLIISTGGSLFLFVPFLGDAICQAQTTIVSHILGARHYHLLNKTFRSAALLASIGIFILSIPLVLFPYQTFDYLFPHLTLSEASINRVSLGIWLSFVFFTLGFILTSYVHAFKDMKFSLFMGGMNWINGFLPLYIAIEYLNMSPDLFWLVLGFTLINNALIYYWRSRYLQSRVTMQEAVNP